MRVAFFGTPDFAVPCLQAVLDAGHEVVCVVAQPDKPGGRGNKMVTPPVIQLARAHNLPTLQPVKLKSGDFPAAFGALEIDVGVVVAYGRILPDAILNHPRRGCINVHASLLPRWRGAAPIQWAIWAGDAVTGVCVQQMVAALDAGPLLSERRTEILPDETGPALFDRLSPLGASLLVETLANLDGWVPRVQDESAVTLARIIKKEDGFLDWRLSASVLSQQVRALCGWPGTFVPFRGEVLKILRVEVCEGVGAPGTLLEGGAVACGVGALRLVEVQLPGKRAVSGRDFINGARLSLGEVL